MKNTTIVIVQRTVVLLLVLLQGCAESTNGAVCGDNRIEMTEVCDSTNLSGYECYDLHFSDGTLKCSDDCHSWDVSSCTGPIGNIEGGIIKGGSVDCGAAPFECLGTVYLKVTESDPLLDPNTETIIGKMIENVDLGTNSDIDFYISDVPIGTVWLSGFLDDDGNASPENPYPSQEDIVSESSQMLDIEQGIIERVNIFFSTRFQ